MTGYSTFADAMASSRSAGGAVMVQPRRGRSPKLGGGNASILSSDINLINTIIGAGTLAMPFAMSHFGIVLGVVLILWCGFTSAFGLYLQSRCARYMERGTSSFFGLSQLTLPNLAVIFDAAIAIKCFGVGVSYMTIIGDLMPAVAPAIGLTGYAFLENRNFWIAAFFAFAIVPLSFPRTLDSLKYTSVIALLSIGYLIVLVAYHFAVDSRDQRGDLNIITWDGPVAALSSLPVMIFAYTCHQNMFSILNELKDNSAATVVTVIGSSIGTAAAVYILVAITGYLTFGSHIVANIVGMYPASVASTIAKAAIVVLVTFSVPLQVHPLRASVDAVLRWRPKWNARSSSPSSVAGSQPLLSTAPPTSVDSHGAPVVAMSEYRFAWLTSVILVSMFIFALRVSNLGKILSYVGATGSTTISFILPGCLYYLMSDPNTIHHQRLTKEDDDADYSDSAGNNVEDDPETGLSRAGGSGRSWAASMVSKVRARSRTLKAKLGLGAFRWDFEHLEQGLLRKAALGLAIYGGVVMVVCLISISFFGQG
ncbi:Transmembrane amino acid transporter domain containing protein [Rhypophila decipiens]